MPRKRYEYISHTADIAFKAYGKDLRELIENAAEALLSVILDIKKIRNFKGMEESFPIKESAHTTDDLLWFTLQDVLSLREINSLSAFALKIKSIQNRGSKIELNGVLLYKEPEKDYTLLDVKAVTPHDLSIKKKKSGLSVVVTIDI